jgi:4-hydroxythreonine-4-phosphate dehydrogenase
MSVEPPGAPREERRAPPLVLTLGDPAGIGPEIAALAWERLRDSGPNFFLAADPEPLARAARALRLPPIQPIEAPEDCRTVFADGLPVLACAPLARPAVPGKPDPANAQAVTGSIDAAVAFTLAGRAGGVVTNPIAKSVLHAAGFKYPGHTEYLAALTESAPAPEPRGPVMMLVGGGLRVALATIHEPIAAVPRLITTDRIVRTALIVDRALKADFGIARPRIGLLGLNPHAGESGDLGREEIEIINPAAAKLRNEHGVDISDALPGDTAFAPHERARFDAFVAMYHDQGLIPVKTLDFDGGVNVTLGLPIVRTSPDHGTAFGIAGAGEARPNSLIAAIRLAGEIAARRAASGR